MSYKIIKIKRLRDPKSGRYLKSTSKKKNVIEEFFEQLIDVDKRRIVQVQKVFTSETVHKIGADDIAKLKGKKQGKISEMLDLKNLRTAKILKGAQQVMITIKGKDYRDKEKRIKGIIDVKGEKNLADLMTGKIAGLLHDKGFRPQYKIDIVRWDYAKTSKSFSKSKKQLSDMSIVITIKK